MSHKRHDTAEIIAWYQDGLSLREIGRRVGITAPAVRSVLVHNNITPRTSKEAYDLRFPHGRSGRTAAHWKGGRRVAGQTQQTPRSRKDDATADDIATWYLSGAGIYAIATHLRCDPATIRRRLLAHGVTLRTPKENRRLMLPGGGFGSESPHWKGGRTFHAPPTDHRGAYVYIFKPDHPAATKAGYVMEHRLVMEAALGRLLTDDEVVHHKNGCRSDNRPDNLQVLSNGEHIRLHFQAIRENDELKRRCQALEETLGRLTTSVPSPTP